MSALLLPICGQFKCQKRDELGPIKVTVKDKGTVNIRLWAGVDVIAIGDALLATGGKKS